MTCLQGETPPGPLNTGSRDARHLALEHRLRPLLYSDGLERLAPLRGSPGNPAIFQVTTVHSWRRVRAKNILKCPDPITESWGCSLKGQHQQHISKPSIFHSTVELNWGVLARIPTDNGNKVNFLCLLTDRNYLDRKISYFSLLVMDFSNIYPIMPGMQPVFNFVFKFPSYQRKVMKV